MLELHQDARRVRTRCASPTTVQLAPVVLVAAWGIAWIAVHASQEAYAHILFQTLAVGESVIALLLRRRKPVGALAGILGAYFAFQLDPLLLPPLLIALFTVATRMERRTVLLATALGAATVSALPLTGRASVDLASYLLPRLLAVATTAAIGLRGLTDADQIPEKHYPPSPTCVPARVTPPHVSATSLSAPAILIDSPRPTATCSTFGSCEAEATPSPVTRFCSAATPSGRTTS